MAQTFIYQIHISLLDIQPTVWRRFTVPSDITFKKFHEAIQAVMGWSDSHLFEFKFGSVRIEIPDDEADDSSSRASKSYFDARRKKLSSMNFEADDFLTYTYDFGDNWAHVIRIEAVYPASADELRVECLEGERACPPEDVGGLPGFERFLEILGNKKHPEYHEMRTWSGGDYDPLSFDVDAVNEDLRALKIVKVKKVSRLGRERERDYAAEWASIPDPFKEKILSNVWCSGCGDVRRIMDYEVEPQHPSGIVLKGTCEVCGGPVARVLEG